MDYLTVKEVAELKGCSEQYIKKLCKVGKLQAEQHTHPQNKGMCYMIPVSALSEDLKTKYYNNLRKETGLAPELKSVQTPFKEPLKTVQKPFDEYTAEERETMALWCTILKDWQNTRIKYKNMTDVDENFVGKCKLEYPDIDISVSILYRKYNAFVNNNYDGLLDHRGGWNKGQSSISEHVWKMFTKLYLSPSRPKVSRIYRDVVAWCMTYYPEEVATIPSERTFRRRVKSEIPECVLAFARKGNKACFDKYLEYVERDYASLCANDMWIADNHTLDIISLSEDGKPHRLSLTAYQDAKSGVIVGWNVCDHPNSNSTLLALRSAVKRGFGLPYGVYFDNGSEFLVKDIGQRGHRKKKDWNKEDYPPTILELLGIQMLNALVKRARSKNIERYFYTFKEWISKAFSGYCGGTILERPEELNQKIKNKEIPTDQEVISMLEVLIDGGYNARLYGGKENRFKGKTRIDVWNESINSDGVLFRDASDDDLKLLLARVSGYQKIKRNGVCVELYGKKYWFNDDETAFNIGREVYVRYDPSYFEEVRVYDRATDQYLWTYKRADYLHIDYKTDDTNAIQTAEANRRRVQKAIKQKTNEYTSDTSIEILSARINEAEINLSNFQVQKPSNFEPVTANEINMQYPERENIVEVDLSELEELREMNNRLERAKRGA